MSRCDTPRHLKGQNYVWQFSLQHQGTECYLCHPQDALLQEGATLWLAQVAPHSPVTRSVRTGAKLQIETDDWTRLQFPTVVECSFGKSCLLFLPLLTTCVSVEDLQCIMASARYFAALFWNTDWSKLTVFIDKSCVPPCPFFVKSKEILYLMSTNFTTQM